MYASQQYENISMLAKSLEARYRADGSAWLKEPLCAQERK